MPHWEWIGRGDRSTTPTPHYSIQTSSLHEGMARQPCSPYVELLCLYLSSSVREPFTRMVAWPAPRPPSTRDREIESRPSTSPRDPQKPSLPLLKGSAQHCCRLASTNVEARPDDPSNGCALLGSLRSMEPGLEAGVSLQPSNQISACISSCFII